MSTLTEFDIAPLSWIREEIGHALTQVSAAISPQDFSQIGPTELRLARTYLHQITGALEMVGLRGTALVCHEAENLTQRLEQSPQEINSERLDAIRITGQTISQYLDDLLSGKPNVELQLLPLYHQLHEAQGITQTQDSDLYFPNLEARPSFQTRAADLTQEARIRQYKMARAQFERGLLDFLRQQSSGQGLANMKEAASAVESAMDLSSTRTFWWGVTALIDGLITHSIEPNFAVKQLCGRIDSQLRRHIQGSNKIAERLMRDMLYFIANSRDGSERIIQVKNTFGLSELLPKQRSKTERILHEQLESGLRLLQQAETAWDTYLSGNDNDGLSEFQQLLQVIQTLVPTTHNQNIHTLIDEVQQILNDLPEIAVQRLETLYLEIATSLFLLENYFAHYESVQDEMHDQADHLRQRLHAAAYSDADLNDINIGANTSMLDSIARQAQEKLLVAQIAQEIQINLNKIEESLDHFFRSPDQDRQLLNGTIKAIHEISGALNMMQWDQAGQVLQAGQNLIMGMTDPAQTIDETKFPLIADIISAIGLYVDAERFQQTKALSVLRPILIQLGLAGDKLVTPPASDHIEDDLASLKTELTQQLNQLQLCVIDTESQQKLTETLKKIKQDADLVGDLMLKSQMESALQQLSADPVIERMTEILSPVCNMSLNTSTDTNLPGLMSTEQIDTEIFETFLEEAKEVLTSIKNELQHIENSTEQQLKLKEIRRSFHTLKGSGRMAHLNELGETAWALEQLLNQWLQQALNPTDELLKLLRQATSHISTWIDSLSTGTLMDNDYHDIIVHADQIRISIEDKPAQAPLSTPSLAELSIPSFIDVSPDDTALASSTTEIAPTSQIDTEILEIFLEEAREVLSDIAKQLRLIEGSTEQHFELKDLRRDFHTLKGSGRMVHLHELGETAWAIEQLLNQWLQQALNPTDELLELLHQTTLHISTWIDSLTVGKLVHDGYQNIIESANQLRTKIGAEGKIEPQQISTPTPNMVTMTLSESDQSTGVFDLAPARSNMVPEETSTQEAFEISSEFFSAPAPENTPLHLSGDETEKTGQETPPNVDIVSSTEAIESGSSSPLIRIGLNELPQSLFEIYQHEANELLHTLRHQFGLCSIAPYPPVSPDFMRASHTLAGISRLTGFNAVGNLSFALETWLTGLQNHQQTLPEYRHELTKACIERLTDMLWEISEHIEPKSSPDLIEALQQAHFIDEQSRSDSTQSLRASSEPDTETEPPVLASGPAITTLPRESTHSLSKHPFENKLVTEKPTDEKLQPHESTLKTTSTDKKFSPREAAVSFTHLNQSISTPPTIPFTDDVDEQLLSIFLEEALDLMPDIERTLHEWQRTPGNATLKSQILRLLHTLKGSARMAGAMHLGDMSHEFETDVLFLSDDNKQVSTKDFGVFENHLDQINLVIDQLRHPKSSTVPNTATEVSHVDNQQEVTAHTTAIANKEVVEQTLRIPTSTLDRIVNEVGEISISRSRLESTSIALRAHNQELFENTERLRAQLRELDIQAETQMQSTLSLMRNEDIQFDPLEFDRFTRLQELTRMIAESVNDIQTVQQNLLVSLNEADAAITQQGRLSKSVQQTLMHTRMVPLASLADRLHRTVRVAGKDMGKKVSLQLTGKQIEFDGNMLNKLVAPLEHLLRNAVAHGIELPEQRLSANKSEYGEIVLTAKQSSNEMVIMVRDDGRGLDFEAIRSQALKNGLIQLNDQLSEDGLAQLIFTSGFSTTENVSTLSGRGVGMDVVKNEITRMGGRIELHSTPEGLLTTLYLPLILAVTQAILVTANERSYAIDSSIIDQVQVYKPEALKTRLEEGEITWLGNTYPLFYLPQLLEDAQSHPLQQPRSSVLLLRNGNNRVAILVDSMTRNQEIVVKNIGSQLTSVPGITGATVLGNGQVVLILNPVQLAQQQTSVPSSVTLAGDAPSLRRTIMVVDDSLTVRKITSRLLQREGYDVVTAKDGLDALQMLQQHKPDLMLLDIEMPRMDGFELTKVMRSDEHMVNIPIIMITSRTATKHRELAANLGVNAYMGKPFQEDNLLAKIIELIQTTSPELRLS